MILLLEGFIIGACPALIAGYALGAAHTRSIFKAVANKK